MDLGETDTSTSTEPCTVLQTSEMFMPAPMTRMKIKITGRGKALSSLRDMSRPMSTAVVGPMTFDELSELYRVEMKSASLTQPRKDLFKAMANLLTSLRQEYDRQMSIDPDSVMTEGAEQRRKKAERLSKDIVVLRTRKIATMAIRGAEGARNTLECLTDEERVYYDSMLDLTKRQLSEVDRLRGKRVTVPTHIDEPPVRVAEPVPVPEPEPVPEPVQEPMPEIHDDFPPEEPFNEEFDEPFDVPEEPMPDEPAPVAEPEPEPIPEPEPVAEPMPEPVPEPIHEPEQIEDSTLSPTLIRILEDLPEFAGPDRDYKLSKEDLVMLPKVLADVLINTGKATAVAPTP